MTGENTEPERPQEQVALFIDFENIRYSVLNTYHRELSGSMLMDVARRYGLVTLARAYADFSDHPERVQRAGLEVAGYTTQAHFLIGNDLARHVGEASRMDLVQRVNLSRQAMLLTLPGEMGERFRAIALAKGYDSPLRGFAVRDLRHTL